MYKSYYGFKEKPFQMTPDLAHLFMSRGHADTYAHLEYALAEDRGFVVVTGEVGSGKTSLINLLIGGLGADFKVGVLTPGIAQQEQFMETVCRQFGLDVTSVDTAEMPGIFRDFLIRQRSAGNRVILIVDEAQDLTDTTIEELRMFANLETRRQYLVQIILAGRPELKERLQQNRVREFVQRATVSCHLGGLGKDEVGRYIRHRLRYAGGSETLNIFDHEAIESIFVYSRGIPRLANIISDAALFYGYADELKTISKRVIEEVVKDRDTDGIPIGGMRHGNTSPATVQAGADGIDKVIRRDIEEKMHKLENTFSRINQEMNTQNSARKTRHEAGLELTEILKRLETRQAILLESIRSLLH
ncbi:MAG: AAA family ATPase [Deltaproteobacteria bacterium]|nr:AAA family ATPase [Deltaproteobacteria bacterium]